jgi:3'-phosphoadenosine 5'-phosphosulfate sulfotransferase (PAPS reductase)/FAD synthetase
MPPLIVPDEVRLLLENGAHLVVNVSGGSDSSSMLNLLWNAYQQFAWPGEFYVIHAHLGRNEWPFTLPHIQDYVYKLTGKEPVIVSRKKGDLLARWWQRYETLKAQGRENSVPPWSSSAARFCTSELKVSIIQSWVRRQFPEKANAISAVGIRSDESPRRFRAVTFAPEKKSSAPTKKRHVYRWLPIHNFTLNDVWQTLGWTLERLNALRADVRAKVRPGEIDALFSLLDEWAYRMNPAYALGNTRLSCRACVMASRNDLANGIVWNPDHFRDLVDLEITSGFSFQHKRWLADFAPELLTANQRQRLAQTRNTEHQPQQLTLF